MSYQYAVRVSLVAAVLLLVLSLADATLTAININTYGMEVEWNPLMRYLIEMYGVWVMFAFKGFFGAVLIFLLLKIEEQELRKWVTPILMWMVGAYSVICFYGYILITT
ncbi:MAG: hypothetical protein JSW49_00740 [candidate division WOR-3 bacterium]|nr:MAG: hypothetical protein JSW49_00740 [candidate division WOR-3 bacterium]